MTPEPMLFDGKGTGALWRPWDDRNYLITKIDDVRQMLRVGAPENDEHLRDHVDDHTYDQGRTPACVSHTHALTMTGNEHIERRGELLVFDAMGLHAETGPINQGRWPNDVLKVIQERGILRVGTSKRYRLGSYAFLPTTDPTDFVTAAKATLAAGYLCGLCTRLWSGFGWETGGQLLGWETYHSVLAVGYRSTPAPLGSVLVKNSWGAGFGQNGFAWIPFQLLVMQNFQDRAIIWNTQTDAIDDDLDPNPPPPPPADPAAEVVRLTNAHRVSKGLAPLAVLPGLTASAQAKSQDMAAKRYFAHVGPDGKGPLDWIKAQGINPSHWGENIAAGQVDPSTPTPGAAWVVSAMRDGVLLSQESIPEGAFTDWINSPGHRANIEFAAFTHIGVGFINVPGTPYGTYWTMHLVRLSADPPPPPPPPPPPVTLKVTGYTTSSSVPAVPVGEAFQVLGEFPAGGNLFVSFGGTPLTVQSRATSTLTVVAPPVPGLAPVSVRIEASEAVGPLLAVRGGGGPDPPPPPPPSDLTVQIGQKRYGGGKLLIAGSIREPGGRYIAGTLTGRAGDAVLESRQTTIGPSGAVPAVWFLVVPVGAPITLIGTTVDGRTASGSTAAGAMETGYMPGEMLMWERVFGGEV